ncbi:MAG: membrane protein insertase YidC [Formivibrio sp.]|nr:membrane protein insertase YidC [Formivibrio sp.]
MDSKKLTIFVLISVVLMFGWQTLMDRFYPERSAQRLAASAPASVSASNPVATASGVASGTLDAGLLQRGQRITVKTDVFSAEIDSNGADLRSVNLLKHGESDNPQTPFPLLTDAPGHIYVAQTGLLGDGLPTHKSEFKAAQQSYKLADGQNELAVRLEAAGPEGVKVAKTYVFKRGSYLVDVKYEIINGSAKPITASAYYRFLRDDSKQATGRMGTNTFTGPAVYTDEGKFQKIDFAKLAENKATYVEKAKDGWVAMLQHYFATAWIVSPTGGESICGAQACRYDLKKLPDGLFSAGVIADLPQVAAGGKLETSIPLFLGPEDTRILKPIAPGLNLVKDYGWVTIIATPLFWLLEKLHSIVGNWGWAIILLTMLIKAAFFPLSAASYRSMAKMRVLAPRMAALKERYGDDRMKLQQAMMAMYKEEKVNPLGGCLPMLIQIPVFIALYWTLLASVEIRQAPWLGWIVDLSSKDPYYILPVLMTISMYVQSLLSPPPPDPMQAKIMKIMPLAFSVMFFMFPAGLVLYWVVNNSLSILQQWVITRQIERSNKIAKA